MSYYDDLLCSQCNCKTDQVLMLSCEHNLCLNCAAKYLSKDNEQQNYNNTQFVICEICGSRTEVDSETSRNILSSVLQNLNINPNNFFQNNNTNQSINMNNNINDYTPDNTNDNNDYIPDNNNDNSDNYIPDNNDNTNDYIPDNNNENNNYYTERKINNKNNNNNYDQNFYNNNTNYSHSNFNTDSSNIISNINIMTNNTKNLCREHHEPLTYLCLDCLTQCICSECVVHGIHKDHEVLNIKKAYPLIYNKTQELTGIIGNKRNELNSLSQIVNDKKNNIKKLNDKCKVEIKNAFQIIRLRINEKEKEIMDKAESALKDNYNELNTYYHVIQTKIASLDKILDTLNTYLMRKDELTLLNYYCENKTKIINQAEMNMMKNSNFINNNLSNFQINIDKNSFDNLLSALSGLQFEINNFNRFRGNDMNQFSSRGNLYNENYFDDSMGFNKNYENNGNMYGDNKMVIPINGRENQIKNKSRSKSKGENNDLNYKKGRGIKKINK